MPPRLPTSVIAVLAFAAGGLVAGHAFSQDGEKPEHIRKGEAQYRQIFETMSRKGPQHAWLAERAGTYEGTVKVQTTFSPEPLEYAWTSTTTLFAENAINIGSASADEGNMVSVPLSGPAPSGSATGVFTPNSVPS